MLDILIKAKGVELTVKLCVVFRQTAKHKCKNVAVAVFDNRPFLALAESNMIRIICILRC